MPHSDPTTIPDAIPVDRVDALYGLPLDEFTTARDALAAELRQASRREEAAWVKGLRKPTAAAWLVNQLARSQKGPTRALLEAGEGLRAAGAGVLGGSQRRSELRRASDGERAAIRALLSAAEGLLDADGRAPSRSTLDKAEETLKAVARDEDARAAFALGRLTRERRVTGLGLSAGEGAPPTSAAEERERTRRSRARHALARARDEERTRRDAVARAARALEHARADAQEAERRLKSAARELERARAAEAKARESVAAAEAAADEAQ